MINDVVDLNSGMNLAYGEGATGKTTLALMLAYTYSKFSKVIFIDTENGFNFDRFKQIAKDDYELCLRNILLLKVNSFEDQEKKISNLVNTKEIALIIVDSLSNYYRLELKKDPKDTNAKMAEMLRILRNLNKENTKVILTSQVYNNFNTNKLESVGGNMVKRMCSFIFKLEKSPRKIVIEKPIETEYEFEIKDEGIVLR